MKVLTKIEKCVVTLFLTYLRIGIMLVGLGEVVNDLLYNSNDIFTVMVIGCIVIMYVEIKKCVFKFIEIIKG